ncbi:MAG: ATPase [Desulfitobacteriaceae bacterium]|nr:ATPase [Desulfitobacteriaceae bacterium]MDD4754002.1 ATPase [Desulfitobacteriaceae bacterium]
MDVIKLLDEMENVIDSGSRVPVIGRVMVDADLLFEYMDKVRAAIPEEIRQAKFVNMEKEKVLKEAQLQAGRILEEAGKQAARMVAEDQLVKQAQIQADEIVELAKRTSDEIKQGAKSYANDLLHQLEINLEKALYTIKKGREELQNNHQRTNA